MDSILGSFAGYLWVLPILLAVVFYKFTLRLFGAVIIGENKIGIVNKRWVLFGQNRTLPDGKIIALNGEAGYQADTLGPGLKWGLWPWQYTVKQEDFFNVPQGKVGVVEARDGAPSVGRILGKKVECDAFQNARDFLTKGGARGPQMQVVPPGAYRINTELFSVVLADAKKIPDGKVGIVTTQDGAPLRTGDIAGREVAGHNMFQDGDAFIDGGGSKGLQEQVMLAGTYYVNPRFVTVEEQDLTEVEIGNVGVVISYVGEEGTDLSGADFTHGNIVERGKKGVWQTPLDPGKYPINPHTHKVIVVPTTNIVLNWANSKTESHNLDANLSTITLRHSDGLTSNLDVSQIIHIKSPAAPNVIARFGSISNLVTQVLEPTIGNHFRNSAQTSDAIKFLSERTLRQEQARNHIEAALNEYDVQAVDTLIGDIVPPASLMTVLSTRKIAEQEKITFETQERAETQRQLLEEARAKADTQAGVVSAQRQVQIADFTAQAAVNTAKGAAESKTINAKADAEVTTLNGNAEAGKIKAIGTAEADVVRLKIESMEAGNYAAIAVAKELAGSGFKLVPDVVVGSSGNGSTDATGLLTNLMVATMARSSLVGTTPAERKVPAAAEAKSETTETKK
jgi:uncharacterized membrane protein YqiK